MTPEAVSSCPIICYLGKEPDTHLTNGFKKKRGTVTRVLNGLEMSGELAS